jgi:quinol monooxygenase YgiN
MIVEYIRYKVPSDDAARLIKAYEVAGSSLQASSHCLGFELSRCSESSETFVLRILWDSADGHLEGFRTSHEFGPFFQAIQPFVKSIEEMRHYELTTVRWSR